MLWTSLACCLFLAFMSVFAENSDDEDSGSKYVFTTIEYHPFLIRGEAQGDQHSGFIPDFIKKLCEREAVPCNYKFQLVKDGKFGSMDVTENRWVGMIGELIATNGASVADLAAAPLIVTSERKRAVNFTNSWLNFSLAAVTRRDNGLQNLSDAISNRDVTPIGAVRQGSALKAISMSTPYSDLWSAIESNPNSKVTSVAEGLDRSLMGNYTFITESTTAEYLTNKHCELHVIDEFLPQKGYAFAVADSFAHHLPDLNEGINQMINDGEIENLREKWFRSPCVSGQDVLLASAWLILGSTIAGIFLA